jgi:hypothetical protein
MIDNIEIIKPLLNFDEEGDFYHLMILKRKKDQPEGERDNHQSVRTIKTYCVDSIEYLDKRYDEIKQLCEIFKARAYIHVQKQNHKDVAMNMITEIVHRIQSGQINQQHVFDSVVGQMKTMEKRWVVDVDSSDLNHLTEVINYINEECPPFLNRSEIHTHTSSGVVITYERAPKWLMTIPTKNGFHIITEKFDVNEFKKRYPEIDIAKKNPTLLYYPSSL